jgi:hypothetical protein
VWIGDGYLKEEEGQVRPFASFATLFVVVMQPLSTLFIHHVCPFFFYTPPDGVFASEHTVGKFNLDMQRLADGVFVSDYGLFAPLMNIWTIFRASAMTGVGAHRAQDTAFKLFR